MNKVIIMGRLTRDPEVRYTQSDTPLAIVRYSLAVNRRFKRDGEPDADFIDCVGFGKVGEFAERFFKKGLMVGVVGRLQVRNWEDQNGNKRKSTEVVVEEQHFGESKSSFEQRNPGGGGGGRPMQSQPESIPMQNDDGFYPIDESVDDDDLPF